MLAKDLEWLCLSHTFRQMWLERKLFKESRWFRDGAAVDVFPRVDSSWLYSNTTFTWATKALKGGSNNYEWTQLVKCWEVEAWKSGGGGKICGSDSWMRILNCVAVKLFPCSYISECNTIIEERLYFQPAASFLSRFWLKKLFFFPPCKCFFLGIEA